MFVVTIPTDLQSVEKSKLILDLDQLRPDQWRATTLCTNWDVEEVVAHLGAAATTSMTGWIVNMVRSRFDTDAHNRRLLERFRGADPADTLARFKRVGPIGLPTKASPAGLAELIVHAEDIRRPLGLSRPPEPEAVLVVARFFAARDFAVNSRTLINGLALGATDADFATGAGLGVTGPLLSLVMAMAGRGQVCDDLSGDGVPHLRARITSG